MMVKADWSVHVYDINLGRGKVKFYYAKNRNKTKTLGTHDFWTKEQKRKSRWRRPRGNLAPGRAAFLNSLFSYGSNDLAECIKCGKTTSGVRTWKYKKYNINMKKEARKIVGFNPGSPNVMYNS
jgi:hypothetical protein